MTTDQLCLLTFDDVGNYYPDDLLTLEDAVSETRPPVRLLATDYATEIALLHSTFGNVTLTSDDKLSVHDRVRMVHLEFSDQSCGLPARWSWGDAEPTFTVALIGETGVVLDCDEAQGIERAVEAARKLLAGERGQR